jgi:hypothetical protein
LAQKGTAAVPPETSQFDFWLGNWDASWGEGLRGTNHVTRRWDRVIVEEFDGKPGDDLEGHSVSVYLPNEKLWKQTWVDSQGAYMAFTGGFTDGKMTLSRSIAQNGKTVIQRMVWYDITRDKFEWNWERSEDGGQTWTVNWNIHYTRRK